MAWNKAILTTKGDKKIIDDLIPDVMFKSREGLHFDEAISGVGHTDEMGRLSKAETDNLKLSGKDRLPHNKNTPGKLNGDHAGHLFGDRFGGSPELDNLVSQLSNVNLSKFKTIENSWAKALKEVPPKKVEVIIIVNYKGNNLRPSSFTVRWK